MNPLLRQILDQLRATSVNTRIALAAGAVVALLLAAVVLTYSNRPHYEVLISGLDASESARVQAALSGAGLRWEVSQPPGPFVVFVDRAQRHRALAAVASSGALERLPGGILGHDGGMSSVFLSAGERQQMVRKREWQEMERLLEELDFVRTARVRTSVPETRGVGRGQTISSSVTLTLMPGERLSRKQAQTVASLVRFGLGIEPESLVIADQAGQSVYDGSELASGGAASEWMDHKERYDQRLQAEVNLYLTGILGPDVARVTVSSAWDFDRTTTIAETTDPSMRAVISEVSSETQGSGRSNFGGGAAGAGSNLQIPGDGFGVDNVGVVVGNEDPVGGTGGSSTTRDTRREYLAPRITTQTVRTTPALMRLSVGLTLDQTLSDKRDEIERLVKAAVGFDARRDDQFTSAVVNIRREEMVLTPDGEYVAVGDQDGSGGMSPWIEILLTRGVEIASSLAFVFLLFVSLRGAKVPKKTSVRGALPGASGGASSGGSARNSDEPEVDPELLAMAQVQELLRTDPDRVVGILSNWAREEHAATRT